MKLLIVTQKIDENDDVLGFMHGWIAEFAKHCEQVIAVSLSVGEHHLPQQVKVLSLGKESGRSRFKYLWNFYRHIFRERHNYDAVFVHMNQEYVLLGGILWKIMRKKIGLWYAHGHVSASLRIAERWADIIFTSTESGFRLPSQKVRVVGQGIDIERFAFLEHKQEGNEAFRVVIVGRLSPVKDYETLLRAIKLLRDRDQHVALDIVGGAALPEQKAYEEKLYLLARELGIEQFVRFHGALPNNMLGGVLGEAHCFANTSRTGSFDKAVGEAMATGLPVLTSNEAFKEVLGVYAEELMFPAGDDRVLSEKLSALISKTNEERNALGRELRGLVERNHSLKSFVDKILTLLGDQVAK